MLSDRLINESVTVERADFEDFAVRKLQDAYRLATLIIGDPIEAQDATHDAFLAAWRHWSALRDPGRRDAWFQRVLVNTCRNALRRRKRQRIVDVSEAVAAMASPGDLATTVVDHDAIARAFAQLKPDHRICLVLRYYEGHSVEEVARLTSVPAGTVKSRLHAALREVGVVVRGEGQVTK